jgi:hypothetical protein
MIAVAFGLLAGPLALGAVAWQGPQWQTGISWSDGRQVNWRTTPALGCDGSNVELQLVNGSQQSGDAALSDITFQCKRGTAPYIAPERAIGSISPGGSYAAPVINCACAEKGGVTGLVSMSIELTRNGDNVEKLSNGCTYTGEFLRGERHGKGVYACPNGYLYEGSYDLGRCNGRGAETLEPGEAMKAISSAACAAARAA